MAKNENYEQRPLAKPSSSTRGRLLRWEDTDYCEFVPVAHDEKTRRTMLKSGRRAQYYKNEGEKESSYTLHVNVPSTEIDPASALMDEAIKTLKSQMKDEPKITVKKFVIDQKQLKVWEDRKEKKLVARLEINTGLHQSLMMQEVSDIFKEVYKTVANYGLK